MSLSAAEVLSAARRFLSRLEPLRYAGTETVDVTCFSPVGGLSWDAIMLGDYQPVDPALPLTDQGGGFWFRLSWQAPDKARGRVLFVEWTPPGDALVWHDGTPYEALAGGVVSHFCVTRMALAGETGQVFLHVTTAAAAGDARLVWRSPAAWELHADVRALVLLAEELPPDSARREQALAALESVLVSARLEEPATWSRAVLTTASFLAGRNGEGQRQVSLLGRVWDGDDGSREPAEAGHALTRGVVRALREMEGNRDLTCLLTEPAWLAWLKEEHGALFDQVQARTVEGRWLTGGGTWVEPAAGLIGGESWVRQLLRGRSFCREEFGTSGAAWVLTQSLPLPATLPQLLKSAGVEHVWVPSAAGARWEGTDGTVLPLRTVHQAGGGAEAVVAAVRAAAAVPGLQRKRVLLAGVESDTVDLAGRLKDVDGFPRVSWGLPAADPGIGGAGVSTFDLPASEAGRLTSQAGNKRDNRRLEELLREGEWLAATAMARLGRAYPGAELRRLWQDALRLQSWNLLGGTATGAVQDGVSRKYAELLSDATRLRDEAAAALAPAGGAGSRVLANPLGFDRFEVMTPPGASSPEVVFVPGLGLASWEALPSTTTPVTVEETDDALTLENAFVIVTLSRGGRLVRWYDKRARREALPPEVFGNRLVLAGDDPGGCEAAGLDPLLARRRESVAPAHEAKVAEIGPLRVTLDFAFKVGAHSAVRQRVTLTALSPRLEFDVAADWWEERRCLQVEFPVAVRAHTVTVELPFGHESRALDGREFAVQRWADVSESGFGVALLNDSKYGMSAEPGLLRLTLLRSPKAPDPECDMGRHRFRYAVVPHGGDWRAGRIVEEAAAFNQPLTVLEGQISEAAGESLFSCDNPAVVIETVKRAETSGALVVRLREAFGGRQTCQLTSSLALKRVFLTDVLEEGGRELDWTADGVALELRAGEVATLRVELKPREPAAKVP